MTYFHSFFSYLKDYWWVEFSLLSSNLVFCLFTCPTPVSYNFSSEESFTPHQPRGFGWCWLLLLEVDMWPIRVNPPATWPEPTNQRAARFKSEHNSVRCYPLSSLERAADLRVLEASSLLQRKGCLNTVTRKKQGRRWVGWYSWSCSPSHQFYAVTWDLMRLSTSRNGFLKPVPPGVLTDTKF